MHRVGHCVLRLRCEGSSGGSDRLRVSGCATILSTRCFRGFGIPGFPRRVAHAFRVGETYLTKMFPFSRKISDHDLDFVQCLKSRGVASIFVNNFEGQHFSESKPSGKYRCYFPSPRAKHSRPMPPCSTAECWLRGCLAHSLRTAMDGGTLIVCGTRRAAMLRHPNRVRHPAARQECFRQAKLRLKLCLAPGGKIQ